MSLGEGPVDHWHNKFREAQREIARLKDVCNELVTKTGTEKEFGLRFLIPHQNAGESIWLPDIRMTVHMWKETPGLCEIVERRVGPWKKYGDT